MTDNEKRAHDLAISSVQIIYDAFKAQASNYISSTGDNKKEFHFDAYTEYIKAYNHLLLSFNRDFPQRE